MSYEIQIRQEPPQLIAAVRCDVKPGELSQVVPRLCGEVWEFLRPRRDLLQPRRHVAVYLDGAITLECGAEVGQRFEGNGRILCSATPGGRVATTRHVGDYARLGDAHAAIREWCAARDCAFAGPNWEIYGHWNDDPDKVYTDVCYLLRGDGNSAP